MTHLILVRHAQTVANVEGRWIGWGDTGLTELGRAQVLNTAQRLAAEVHDAVGLYTSPLPRARRTAEGIGRALCLEPTILEGLREINFGQLDGMSLEEMKARHPGVYARWEDRADGDFTWPGGERRADFFQRVAAACDDILSRHDRGTVVVVSHGGTLRGLLAHLLPGELGEWWAYPLDNCGLTRVTVMKGGKACLALLNDTSHLPDSTSFARPREVW